MFEGQCYPDGSYFRNSKTDAINITCQHNNKNLGVRFFENGNICNENSTGLNCTYTNQTGILYSKQVELPYKCQGYNPVKRKFQSHNIVMFILYSK